MWCANASLLQYKFLFSENPHVRHPYWRLDGGRVPVPEDVGEHQPDCQLVPNVRLLVHADRRLHQLPRVLQNRPAAERAQ